MSANNKFKISVATAFAVIVLCAVGIGILKSLTNQKLNEAKYYIYKSQQQTTEAVTVYVPVASKEDETEPDNRSGSGYKKSSNSSGKSKKSSTETKADKTTTEKTTVATTEKVTVFDSIFVYSESAKKVHSRSCPYVKGINDESYCYINADDADELFEQGYEFCSHCKGYVMDGD